MRTLLLGLVLSSLISVCANGQDASKEKPREAAPMKLQPLSVKTGLWENTMTTSLSGAMGIPPERLSRMTPEQRARIEAALKARSGQGAHTNTYQSCLTAENLRKTPFADKQNCTETLISSSSTQAEIKFECTMQEAKSSGTMQVQVLSDESVQGSGHGSVTMGGKTMNSDWTLTGKWLQASCGDVK